MRTPSEPPPQTALRVVITTTLIVGAILVGILVLRETVAPAWLQPGIATPSATTAAEPIALPPAPRPALPPAVPFVVTPTAQPTAEPTLPPPASAQITTLPAAIEAGPAPSSSASLGGPRRPRPAAAPAKEPAVYELPEDFRYSPAGSSQLMFPR